MLESIAALRAKQNSEIVHNQLSKTTYLEATESAEEARVRSVQTLLSKEGAIEKKQIVPTANDASTKLDTKVPQLLS